MLQHTEVCPVDTIGRSVAPLKCDIDYATARISFWFWLLMVRGRLLCLSRMTKHGRSAGLWRVLDPTEVVQIVTRFYGVHANGYDGGQGDATAAARALVSSYTRIMWSHLDI